MAYITKYGTYFGIVPQQLGRVHFVAPSASYTVDGRAYSASDDNDGLSPERALRTLSQAYTNITASAGEVIYLLDGTHAQTATLRLQKAGITIIGGRSPQYSEGDSVAWANRPKAIISFAGAAAPGLSIEASNVEIGFVTLVPAAGFSTVIFRGQTNSAPDGLYLHDFFIDFSNQPPNLATLGIDFGYRADTAGLAGTSMSRLAQATAVATAYISNFCINSGGANGPAILTATADVVVNKGRFNNRFGTWATVFSIATGTGYVFINGSHWTCQTVNGMGTQVDGSNAGTVNGKASVRDCRFAAEPLAQGVAIDNFAAGVVEVIESYQAQVAGAAGTAQSSSV
jgi:hypothetical protein